MDVGYQEELKNAVVDYHEPFNTEADRQRKAEKIQQWSEADLLGFLSIKHHKTRLAPLWASAILARTDDRAIPPAIRDLLDRVDRHLNPNPSPPPARP